ncbi:hypothetical protein DFH06DRAFT_1237705 [Mycena polygramma]|nr:hypothetical protein DFH06DRAFT_1237705 [Mycena polygramma]
MALKLDELPAHDKIGTNYAPLAGEIAEIKQLILQPRAEIERINRKIAQLKARRRGLSKYVAEHEALISPMRQLPSDVIREIFMACIPSEENPVLSIQTAPLLLGRICSQWRAIALSTPRLWSSIHIAEPHDTLPPRVRDGCLQLVKVWLARSGGLPLSISFHRMPSDSPASPLFDTVLSFSPRWKHISLTGPVGEIGINLSRTDVPLLQTIAISPYAAGNEPTGPETHDFLRGVSVRNVSLGTNKNPIQFPLPWSQLTTLKLDHYYDTRGIFPAQAHGLSSSTALRILAECHNLRECALCLSSGVAETVDTPSSVELPYLDSLQISTSFHDTSVSQPNDPLDRLLLPQLSSFVLKGYDRDPDGVPYPTLVANATKMKSVEVDVMLFTAETLRDFLRRLPPTVHHLLLRQGVLGHGAPTFVDDEFLRFLAPASESEIDTAILPQLDDMELIHAAHFSDEELLRFIRARMGIRPLRRLKVRFFRCVEEDILPQLQPFIDELGLDVSLHYQRRTNAWDPRLGLPRWHLVNDM